MIVIPAIDLKGGRCVRLIQGRMDSESVYSNDPVAMARRWASEGAERLHLVDLDGAVAGAAVHGAVICEIARAVSIPVEVGGGIRSLDQIEKYLHAGVAFVVLGTAALLDGPLVKEAIERFPGQIIAGIDTKNGGVAVRGWTEVYPESVVDLARRMQEAGVASMILTDIEKDGMLAGPNLKLLDHLVHQIGIPVIASGGISTLKHLQEIARLPGVEGAIIGKALYTGAISLPKARFFLERGE